MKIRVRGLQLSTSSESWRSGEEQVCADSGLFDSDWYLEQNPAVAASRMSPLSHYVRLGAAEGLNPTPLFDSQWYLEENPDVAAINMNPLSHYIRWGAAKGLDPSPRFQTTWYLEHNPDVAASGMNPLAHYLLWGAAELREPVSPVQAMFHKLAMKPKLCRLELNRIAETYCSPPDIPPGKARDDNQNQVRASWVEQSMFQSLEHYRSGDLQAALRLCKY